MATPGGTAASLQRLRQSADPPSQGTQDLDSLLQTCAPRAGPSPEFRLSAVLFTGWIGKPWDYRGAGPPTDAESQSLCSAIGEGKSNLTSLNPYQSQQVRFAWQTSFVNSPPNPWKLLKALFEYTSVWLPKLNHT